MMKKISNQPIVTKDQPINNIETGLKYLILLIPAFILFVKNSKILINAPYYDDYKAILQYIFRYKEAVGIEKIKLLFIQYNEHRVFLLNLVVSVYYELFNTINFIHLIYLGYIQLIIIFLIMVFFIKKFNKENWFLLSFVFSIMYFDIIHIEIVNWAMSGLSNLSVIFCFFISLYFYQKTYESQKIRHLILAIIFQIVSIYCVGNGLLSALSIVIFNLVIRSKKGIYTSIVISLIFIPLYFLNYNSSPSAERLSIFSIENISIFFLNLSTNYVHFDYTLLAVILMSLLVYSAFKYRIFLIPKYGFLIAIISFSVSTLLTIAIFRLDPKGAKASYTSRYIIYSVFFLFSSFMILEVLIDSKYNFKKYYTYLILVAVLICYKYNFSYWSKNSYDQRAYRIEQDEHVTFFNKDHRKESVSISDTACNIDLYCIYNRFQ